MPQLFPKRSRVWLQPLHPLKRSRAASCGSRISEPLMGLCQVGLRVGPLTGRLRVPLAWVGERAVVPYGDSMTVAWFRHRPARVPAWVVDAGWAVVVTIAIRAATEPGARPRDLLAYALGWTIGVLLLARRRWPLAVLVASSATLQLYYLLDYPDISAAVPLAVALYTA